MFTKAKQPARLRTEGYRLEIAIALPFNSGIALDTNYGICFKFRGKHYYALWHDDGFYNSDNAWISHSKEKLADDVDNYKFLLWVNNEPIIESFKDKEV